MCKFEGSPKSSLRKRPKGGRERFKVGKLKAAAGDQNLGQIGLVPWKAERAVEKGRFKDPEKG